MKKLLSILVFSLCLTKLYGQNTCYELTNPKFDNSYILLLLYSDSSFNMEIHHMNGWHGEEIITMANGQYHVKNDTLILNDTLWSLIYKMVKLNDDLLIIYSDIKILLNNKFSNKSTFTPSKQDSVDNNKMAYEVSNSKLLIDIKKSKTNKFRGRIHGIYKLKELSQNFILNLNADHSFSFKVNNFIFVIGRWEKNGDYLIFTTNNSKERYYLQINEDGTLNTLYFPILFPTWSLEK